MSQRIVDFFDGNQSSISPVIGNITASDLVVYADDASYEADNAGAPQIGNIYYNSVLNMVRYYNGSTWVTVGTEDAVDANFQIFDDADPTKAVQFQVSGVSPGFTRTLTVPDSDTNIVLDNLSNLSTTSINQDLYPDSDLTKLLGFSGQHWSQLYVGSINNTSGPLNMQATNGGIQLTSDISSITLNAVNEEISLNTSNINYDSPNHTFLDGSGINIASIQASTVNGFRILARNSSATQSAKALTLNAGNGVQGNDNGAAVNINSGVGNVDGNGGNVNIFAQSGGSGTGNGGAVNISGGSSQNSGDGGDVNISSGYSSLSGDGGDLNFRASGSDDTGNGGNVLLEAGIGGPNADTNGGTVDIKAGNGINAGIGGHVNIVPGTGDVDGHIDLRTNSTRFGKTVNQQIMTEYIRGIVLNDSETDTEITELTVDAGTYRSVFLTYTMQGDLGEVKAGYLIVTHNGSSAFTAGPSAEESGIDITFDADIDGTNLIVTYTSGANGATMDVKIERFPS